MSCRILNRYIFFCDVAFSEDEGWTVKKNFSEVLYSCLKAAEYKGKEQNKRLLSAVEDLAEEYPREKKLLQSYGDERFLSICRRAMTQERSQTESIAEKASEYLHDEFMLDEEWAKKISLMMTEAFADYGHGPKPRPQSQPEKNGGRPGAIPGVIIGRRVRGEPETDPRESGLGQEEAGASPGLNDRSTWVEPAARQTGPGAMNGGAAAPGDQFGTMPGGWDPSYGPNYRAPAPQKKRRRWPGIAVGIAVMIIGLAAVSYAIFGNKPASENTADSYDYYYYDYDYYDPYEYDDLDDLIYDDYDYYYYYDGFNLSNLFSDRSVDKVTDWSDQASRDEDLVASYGKEIDTADEAIDLAEEHFYGDGKIRKGKRDEDIKFVCSGTTETDYYIDVYCDGEQVWPATVTRDGRIYCRRTATAEM